MVIDTKTAIQWLSTSVVLQLQGIHGPPGPGTDRSESVRDFQNFVGPGSVRDQPVLIRGSLTSTKNHKQGDIKEKKNSNGVISNSENY